MVKQTIYQVSTKAVYCTKTASHQQPETAPAVIPKTDINGAIAILTIHQDIAQHMEELGEDAAR